ncbi:uncharacterized protein LOC126259646 isoform X3 [Schistocerca nitens]|uniref:uncharacterized protein LOC126259646 isoform X3 n=1 Tax=Schistocerca nitens TaxID=7011 RepID=UPI002118E6BB|nr:uncharacterized protein LOC126259646 isoform X3 [Schistocerca nitens]
MGGHLPRSGAARGSKCAPPCGPEAACRHFPNSTSLCVCVHDASPAVQGRKCPRVAIPVSLRSIPVIVPTNGTNGSLWRTSLQQDGEDGLSGPEECLLEVERDTAHDASRRPRPPAPAPS